MERKAARARKMGAMVRRFRKKRRRKMEMEKEKDAYSLGCCR